MFGFARPNIWTLRQRSMYARMCMHHRHHLGNISGLFHSYDASLLFALAADAKVFPESTVPQQRCCRLARYTDPGQLLDAPAGEYCSHFAMLLFSVKLEDDVRDRHTMGRLRGRILKFLTRKRIKRMKAYFENKTPGLLSRLTSLIADHHVLESKDPSSLDMTAYVVPTAEAFALSFAGLTDALGKPESRQAFEQIGRHFGASLLSYDCAVDYRRDSETGDFNLIKDESGAQAAFKFSIEQLKAAQALAAEVFGANSVSASWLEALQVRVHAIAKRQLEGPLVSQSCRTLENAAQAPRGIGRAVKLTWNRMSLPLKKGDPVLYADCCSLLACHCCQRGCELSGEACCEEVNKECGCTDPCDDCCKETGCDDCGKSCCDDCGSECDNCCGDDCN